MNKLVYILFILSSFTVHAQEDYKYRLIYSSQCDIKRGGQILQSKEDVFLSPDDTIIFYSNSHMRIERYYSERQDSLLVFRGRYGSKRFGDICINALPRQDSWFRKRYNDIKSAFVVSKGLDSPSSTSVFKNEEDVVSFTSIPTKIRNVVVSESESAYSDYIELELLDYKYEDGELYLTNSSGLICYFDIITVVNNQCYSALSADSVFINEDYLEPGASISCRIPKSFNDKSIFIICSEYPIPFNCVSIEDIQSGINEVDIKLLIKKVQ